MLLVFFPTVLFLGGVGGLPFPLVIWILPIIISFHSQNDYRCSSTQKKGLSIVAFEYQKKSVYIYICVCVCVYLFMIIHVYVTYMAGAFICPYPPWNYCSLGDHHHISGDWSKAYVKRFEATSQSAASHCESYLQNRDKMGQGLQKALSDSPKKDDLTCLHLL